MVKRFTIGTCLSLLLILGIVVVVNSNSAAPDNLGVSDGQLVACPESPNCVSTQAQDSAHRIEPVRFQGNSRSALEVTKQILSAMPPVKIVDEKKNYLRAEATSLLFRFVDDVEFYFDETNRLIHFRSASRIGYSDLGANRARMEKIRQALESAG